MGVKRFEDLIFRQKARELTNMIYSYTKNGDFQKDFGLKSQIQMSCVSVMSNIAEGFGRGSNKEFKQYLFIARGSPAEVKSQLYISKDIGYLPENHFYDAYDMTEEISKMIGSFIKSMDTNGKRGQKSASQGQKLRGSIIEKIEEKGKQEPSL